MLHSHIPIMFNFTLHVCANFSRSEHWCASWCWCSPTRHTTPKKLWLSLTSSKEHKKITTKVVVITPQDAKYRIHINNIDYICMCIMCLMPSMWKFWLDEMAKLEPRLRRPRAVLHLSCSWVSEWSKLLGCWRASRLLSLSSFILLLSS